MARKSIFREARAIDREADELLAMLAKKRKKKGNPGPLKIHETKRHVRRRMRDPGEFDPRSFRTIDPGRPGHTKLVIACPRGFYHRGRCSVGTHVQAILTEK